MLSLSPKSPDGWPPGTLKLEDCKSLKHGLMDISNLSVSNQDLTKNLHPIPSNDPDEPLVSVLCRRSHSPN